MHFLALGLVEFPFLFFFLIFTSYFLTFLFLFFLFFFSYFLNLDIYYILFFYKRVIAWRMVCVGMEYGPLLHLRNRGW